MSNADEVLAKIARGDPAVVKELWRSFPSAYDADMMDEKAARRLLKAIVDAASHADVFTVKLEVFPFYTSEEAQKYGLFG